MAKKIVWTKRADKKYDAIVEYLSKEWGERVTEEFIKRTYSFLDLLIDFPEIGTIENAEKGIRGFPLTKHVRVFYRIAGEYILLLNFFDNRQNKNKE
jgi:plasmid stabilization system protein ParE